MLEDPRNISYFTAMTAKIWVEEQAKARDSVSEAPQPFLFLKATEDGVIRNDYVDDFCTLA